MSGDRDEVLGKLSEELHDAMAKGEIIDAGLWAERFGVSEGDVQQCQRGLAALVTSLGEEMFDGLPELPQPALPGDFEVVDELGRGGMGVVYRARQRSLDREVAIKVLRPGDLVFGDALRRFRAEARSLARLRHRHIVSVYDSGETPEGLVWFAMDLVDGRTLADELKSRGRMLPARATKIIRQVTSAIAHAHAQGIVHRDLKPQNVLIDGNGDAFVVDFGLARDAASAGTNTMSGELLGTPTYMSPEQASGDAANIGEACDVWALGTMLYEMLVGKAPFAGKPLHETIRSILHDAPPSMRRNDKKIPPGLELVCTHALQKRPEDRYEGALAFGEDIERFQDGRGVLVQGPSHLRRFGRVLRRRWRSVATIAAAVMVTLGAVAMWLPSMRRDAVVQEAKRLVEAGHPDAAIDSLREVLNDTDYHASDRKQLQYEFVRALNDRAGELLREGDNHGALAVASEALPIASRRTNNGVVRAEEMLEEQRWQWELARACAIADRDRGPLVPMQHLISDLKSDQVGRLLLARRAATMEGVDLSRLNDDEQLLVLCDNLRAQPNIETLDISFHAPTFRWLDRVHECWSPELEDRLAELATSSTESPTARAMAFHMWSRCVGLPTFDGISAAGNEHGSEPTAKKINKAAHVVIADWRKWRDMPREEALKARIDLIIRSMDRDDLLPLADTRLAPVVKQWTGHEAHTTDEYRAWWHEARSRDYTQHLLEALGIEQNVSVLAALDRSAVADSQHSCLWRQLAWLQVTAGVRLPEGNPNATSNTSKWRTACLQAAGIEDERELTARFALLRFDDGSPTPQIVAQRSRTVMVGEQLRFDLRATLAEPSMFSLRRAWEDERRAGSKWLDPELPHLRTAQPEFGEVTTTIAGDVRFDRDGVRFHVQPGLLLQSSLPWSGHEEHNRGVKRVWAGSAAAIDSALVQWDMDRRMTRALAVFALHEGPRKDAEPDIEWWHQAIAASFAKRTRPEASRLSRSHSADWLTASQWPMPEMLPAMQELEPGQPADAEQRLAKAMAGDNDQTIEWTRFWRPEMRAAAVRIALGAASETHRKQAMHALSDKYIRGFTPRVAATLRQGIEADAIKVPAQVQSLLEEAPAPDSIQDWLTRSFVWPFLAWACILISAGTFSSVRPRGSRGAQTFVWAALCYMLMFVRIRIGDTIVTPSWVAIVLVTWIIARGSQGRSWWRTAGLGLMGIAAAWSVASAWVGVQPPLTTELYFAIAALVALHVPASQLERSSGTAALPIAPAQEAKTRIRAQRHRDRWGRRFFGAVIIAAFVLYAGLQVLSSYMSKELLGNAEVRIIDEDGMPIVGARSFLQWTEPSPYLTGMSLPPSDENGYVDLSSIRQKTATLARFYIDVHLPGAKTDWVPLELDTTISLPPVGSLTVQLVDDNGHPWRDPSNRHCKVYAEHSAHHHSFDDDGRATFPLFASGRVKLRGTVQGSSLFSPAKIVDGPSRSGESKTIKITIPSDMPRVTGALKNPDGTPFTKDAFLSWRGRSGSLGGFAITPDASGRFQFLMSTDPAGGTVELRQRFGKTRKIRVPESESPIFDIGTIEMPPN